MLGKMQSLPLFHKIRLSDFVWKVAGFDPATIDLQLVSWNQGHHNGRVISSKRKPRSVRRKGDW